MSIRFLLHPSSAEKLKKALAAFKDTITVEAEYGETVVEGSILTMAHHGSRTGQPAPCSYSNQLNIAVEAVGLSHIDLDSLGGCAAVLNSKPEAESFWKLAEFVDLNGPHKLAEAYASGEDLKRLYAFWAWSAKDENRVHPPKDGGVEDVTEKVAEGVAILHRIMADDPELLQAGAEFLAQKQELDAKSLIGIHGGVIVRESAEFVNHLYNAQASITPGMPIVGAAVVSFNTKYKSITVSFADASVTVVTACDIVQALWGKEAGGHALIAGSPRGQEMTLTDLGDAVIATHDVLRSTDSESFPSFLGHRSRVWSFLRGIGKDTK